MQGIIFYCFEVLAMIEKIIFVASLLFLPKLLSLLKENFVEYRRSKRMIKSDAIRFVEYKEKNKIVEARNRALKQQYQQIAGKPWKS